MCRHEHLLLFSSFCCAVLLFGPLSLKAVLLFWAFMLHSRIDHYFTAWGAYHHSTALIRDSKHNRDIWSFHYWHALLFLFLESETEICLKNAVCLLRISKRLDQIQNRLSWTSVWFCFRALAPQGRSLFLRLAVSSCPISTKQSCCWHRRSLETPSGTTLMSCRDMLTGTKQTLGSNITTVRWMQIITELLIGPECSVKLSNIGF